MLSKDHVLATFKADFNRRNHLDKEDLNQLCTELVSRITFLPTEDLTAEQTFFRAFLIKRLNILLHNDNSVVLTVLLPKKELNTEEIINSGYFLAVVDNGEHFEMSTFHLYSHGGYRD